MKKMIAAALALSLCLCMGTTALAAGVEGDYANADSDAASLTISGTPNSSVTAEGVTVGTITVTIE